MVQPKIFAPSRRRLRQLDFPAGPALIARNPVLDFGWCADTRKHHPARQFRTMTPIPNSSLFDIRRTRIPPPHQLTNLDHPRLTRDDGRRMQPSGFNRTARIPVDHRRFAFREEAILPGG
jgi:hypothetical protein